MIPYGNSAMNYDQMRRGRRARMSWSVNNPNGLQGYAGYLAGYGDSTADVSSIVAGEVAGEMDSASGDAVLRAIGVGVATGVITFLLNRWLEGMFK